MKALTICQPYAHLIVRGEKRVENREWPTRYRGTLLIHAGKSRDWLRGAEPAPDMEFGALVGMGRLADCLHIDEIEDGKHDEKYPWLYEHEHTVGTWCWVLQDVVRFASPLPYKGAQGLWDVPNHLVPLNTQSGE